MYKTIPDEKSRFVLEAGMSNLLTGLLFTWFNPIIKIGQERTLTKHDMIDLPAQIHSENLLKTFVKLYESKRTESKLPTCAEILHRQIFYRFWLSGFYRLCNDILLVLGAYLIKLIIADTSKGDISSALSLAAAIMVASVLQVIFLQQFIHLAFVSGSEVVSIMTSTVFYASQSLHLHKSDPPLTIGQINNVQSKDAAALRDFVVFFHNLWACPLVIVACIILLFDMLGFAGIVSCVLLVLLMPLETYISSEARLARKAVLVHSDRRMASVNDMIDGIRTVKLTNLGGLVYSAILGLRDKELGVAWKSMLIEIANTIVTKTSSLLITLVTFFVYWLTSSTPLTADRAFAALAVIGIIGRPLQVIPTSITLLTDAQVSIARIEAVIKEAMKFDPRLLSSKMFLKDGAIDSVAIPSGNTVTLDDATAVRLPAKTAVLRSISYKLVQPSLVVVVGANASGKTSLLLTMLNELLLQKGSAEIAPVDATVAYSGHTAWIVNATAKENILLASSASRAGERRKSEESAIVAASVPLSKGGSQTRAATRTVPEDFDEEAQESQPLYQGATKKPPGGPFSEAAGGDARLLLLSHENIYHVTAPPGLKARYDAAVKACSLDRDFATWPASDDTVIGEKGINISGGQKQRISRLDAIVSAQVVREVIVPAAQTRLVVATTSTGGGLLAAAGRVIVLHQGELLFDGTFDTLVRNQPHVLETVGISVSEAIQAKQQQLAAGLSSASSSASTSSALLGESKGEDTIVKVGDAAAAAVVAASGSQVAPKRGKRPGDDLTNTPSVFVSIASYLQSCGWDNIAAAVAFTLLAYSGGVLADYQLKYWMDGTFTATQYFTTYAIIAAVVVVTNFGRYFMYSFAGITASRLLHDKLLRSILGATFAFFAGTPSGRIASRFSVDFNTIDFDIPKSSGSLVDAGLGIITGVLVVVIGFPLYLVAVVPLTWKYFEVQGKYRAVSKELKKIDSASKSPLFSHFREMLDGVETIRGYGLQSRVAAQHHILLDRSIQSRLNWDAANRWLGIRLDLVGALIVSAAALAVALSHSTSGGGAGLMLSYALKATQSLSFAIRAATAMENLLTSYERVDEYINKVEQEEEEAAGGLLTIEAEVSSGTGGPTGLGAFDGLELVTGGAKTTSNDPTGVVVLEATSVSAGYAKDSGPVLRSISFQLRAGRLVGAAGRTGGGKSTLAMLAARALPQVTGELRLLGAPANSLPLSKYRSAVQVYPQDAFIFSGSIRQSLDPYNKYSDAKLESLLWEFSRVVSETHKEAPTTTLTTTAVKKSAGGQGGSVASTSASGPSGRGDSAGASDSRNEKTPLLASSNIVGHPGPKGSFTTAAAAAASGSAGDGGASAVGTNQLDLKIEVSAGGSNLSAGQRQVVVLAGAALSQARLVVLDEITTNMDSTAARRAISIIRNELLARDTAVLLIAHGLEEVALCDEVWVVSEGEIVEQGAPAELLRMKGGHFAALVGKDTAGLAF